MFLRASFTSSFVFAPREGQVLLCQRLPFRDPTSAAEKLILIRALDWTLRGNGFSDVESNRWGLLCYDCVMFFEIAVAIVSSVCFTRWSLTG